jgi:hypothetical protein
MDLFGIKRRDKKLHEYIKNGIASIATPKEINMETNEILNILNKHSKLDERYQIKYISPSDYSKLANEIEEAINYCYYENIKG